MLIGVHFDLPEHPPIVNRFKNRFFESEIVLHPVTKYALP